MKKFLLQGLSCLLCAVVFSQHVNNDLSQKWYTRPVKGIMKGSGRLNLNFAMGTQWSLDIYSHSNKFLTNKSVGTWKLNYYDLPAGIYNIKVNTVLIENVRIESEQETTLKTGVLHIKSTDWELRSEDKRKFLTSDNKARSMVLPVGKYQLEEGKVARTVLVNDESFNLEILIDDEYQYRIDPVNPGEDTNLISKGRLNLEFPYVFQMGETFTNFLNVFTEGNGSVVYSCGSVTPCRGFLYLPEGKYVAHMKWIQSIPNPVVTTITPFPINFTIRKGGETRLKTGIIRHLTKGKFKILDEANQTVYNRYITQTSNKRNIPVGKYTISVQHIGDFPIEIKDSQLLEFSPLPEKMPDRYKIVPGKFSSSPNGRLVCSFPKADTIRLSISILQPNGTVATVMLNSDTSLYLRPGNYDIALGGVKFPVKVERNKDTQLIFGYLFNAGSVKGKFTEVNTSLNSYFYYPKKTMPVPVGYYYFKLEADGNERYELFKIAESEIVQYQGVGW